MKCIRSRHNEEIIKLLILMSYQDFTNFISRPNREWHWRIGKFKRKATIYSQQQAIPKTTIYSQQRSIQLSLKKEWAGRYQIFLIIAQYPISKLAPGAFLTMSFSYLQITISFWVNDLSNTLKLPSGPKDEAKGHFGDFSPFWNQKKMKMTVCIRKWRIWHQIKRHYSQMD